MKINEFAQQDQNSLSFDIVDDAVVFMRNDPIFYRKKYFPAIASVADEYRNNQNLNRSVLGNMVDSGINSYCKKYKIAKAPADVFTAEDREAIIEKICSEELKEIENGAY